MQQKILLASAPSLEKLTKLINRYFFSDDFTVDKDFIVFNSKGEALKNFRVIKRKSRYRFEAIQQEEQ